MTTTTTTTFSKRVSAPAKVFRDRPLFRARTSVPFYGGGGGAMNANEYVSFDFIVCAAIPCNMGRRS